MAQKKKQYEKLMGKVNYFTPTRRSSFSDAEDPKYEIQLCNLETFDYNKETLAKLDGMDTKIREEDKYADRGRFVTSSSSYHISTLDSQKKPIPEDLPIGNGTEVIAIFEVYHTPKGKFTFGLGIRKVQIVNLVEYEKKESKEDVLANLFDDVDGGFIAPAPAVEASPSPAGDLDDEIPF